MYHLFILNTCSPCSVMQNVWKWCKFVIVSLHSGSTWVSSFWVKLWSKYTLHLKFENKMGSKWATKIGPKSCECSSHLYFFPLHSYILCWQLKLMNLPLPAKCSEHSDLEMAWTQRSRSLLHLWILTIFIEDAPIKRWYNGTRCACLSPYAQWHYMPPETNNWNIMWHSEY